MTQEYLIGEVSVRLEQLQAATAKSQVQDVARLRREVETKPVTSLATTVTRALALADGMCWDSLSRGDVDEFDQQARISADLRLFGLCARLFPDA
jgi:hypothetical protein